MKTVLGIIIGFALGFACRWFGIPSPAPPVLSGALLVTAITVGYTVVGHFIARHPGLAQRYGGAAGHAGRGGETPAR
jgi:XapX domain-containing protein